MDMIKMYYAKIAAIKRREERQKKAETNVEKIVIWIEDRKKAREEKKQKLFQRYLVKARTNTTLGEIPPGVDTIKMYRHFYSIMLNNKPGGPYGEFLYSTEGFSDFINGDVLMLFWILTLIGSIYVGQIFGQRSGSAVVSGTVTLVSLALGYAVAHIVDECGSRMMLARAARAKAILEKLEERYPNLKCEMGRHEESESKIPIAVQKADGHISYQ